MARPPLLRARARSGGAATKTPSAAVPGTARDLLFSFTKKGKEKKKERKKAGKKVGQNRTQDASRDRCLPSRRSVGGKGPVGGEGAEKEGDWASRRPRPRPRLATPLAPSPLPPTSPQLREGSGVEGLGSPLVLGQRPSTWRGSKPHWTPMGFPLSSGRLRKNS